MVLGLLSRDEYDESKDDFKGEQVTSVCTRTLEPRGGERFIIQESTHCDKCSSSRLVPVPWESRGCVDGQRRDGYPEWKER